MPAGTRDPWSDVERAVVTVGTMAEEADRYRLIREGEGPRLLAAALSLGGRTRALHRHGSVEHNDVMVIARDLDGIAARYGELLEQVFSSPEYRAVLAAYARADHAVLARLIPAVFADVGPAGEVRDAYHPVSVSAASNRTLTAGALADRLVALCTTGIAAAEPGGPGTDGRLRAVRLQDDWQSLATPTALRLNTRALAVPLFRLASSAELLVYTDLLTAEDSTATPTVVIARAAGSDRWPQTGADYKKFRTALVAALDARRVAHTLLDG